MTIESGSTVVGTNKRSVTYGIEGIVLAVDERSDGYNYTVQFDFEVKDFPWAMNESEITPMINLREEVINV